MKPYWLPSSPKTSVHQNLHIVFFPDPFHQLGLVFYPTRFERLNFIIPKACRMLSRKRSGGGGGGGMPLASWVHWNQHTRMVNKFHDKESFWPSKLKHMGTYPTKITSVESTSTGFCSSWKSQYTSVLIQILCTMGVIFTSKWYPP